MFQHRVLPRRRSGFTPPDYPPTFDPSTPTTLTSAGATNITIDSSWGTLTWGTNSDDIYFTNPTTPNAGGNPVYNPLNVPCDTTSLIFTVSVSDEFDHTITIDMTAVLATLFWSDGSDETVDDSDTASVSVRGGSGPFTWGVIGTGFTMDESVTDGRANTLIASSEGCGSATITVTDYCGEVVTGYVRCTAGEWIDQEDHTCPIPGPNTDGVGWDEAQYKTVRIEGIHRIRQSYRNTAIFTIGGGYFDCSKYWTNISKVVSVYCQENCDKAGCDKAVQCMECVTYVPDATQSWVEEYPCQYYHGLQFGNPATYYRCYCTNGQYTSTDYRHYVWGCPT